MTNPSTAMIYTGTGDTIVAPAVARDFARRACALGKTVDDKLIQGGGHPRSRAPRHR
ncbi:MAG: hypothetical protein M3R41_00045 [Pseudomonadota bacterium]|nr:hypothetical protein [Pseudomonadota bacterium]